MGSEMCIRDRFAPSSVGVNSKISSLAAITPGTLAVPLVLIKRLPASVTSKAWISSPFAVRPTSEPSKYSSNVPSVSAPVTVGMNRTISESSIFPKPVISVALVRLNKIELSGRNVNASISDSIPTSDPSK